VNELYLSPLALVPTARALEAPKPVNSRDAISAHALPVNNDVVWRLTRLHLHGVHTQCYRRPKGPLHCRSADKL
jgi:hypothetical protein